MKRSALVLLALLFPIAVQAGPACDRGAFSIALDAGHSWSRPGTTSARGVPEHRFNRDVVRMLKEDLRSRGFAKVVWINEPGDDVPLAERVRMANGTGAGLLLSIHHDSVQPRYLADWTFQGRKRRYSDRFSGYSLFYSEANQKPAESLGMARLIGEELRRSGFRPSHHHAEKIEGENRELVDPDKGIYRFDGLAVLKSVKMPAVLVECGIILNREEEVLLSDPVYQRALVSAIGRAVERRCEGSREERK